MALGAAIVALGLTNGSNAGQAIAEAMASLRAEREPSDGATAHVLPRAVERASTQIVSFLVNAAERHAGRELHRRARVAELADRHHLVLRKRPRRHLRAGARSSTIAVIAAVIASCKRLELRLGGGVLVRA